MGATLVHRKYTKISPTKGRDCLYFYDRSHICHQDGGLKQLLELGYYAKLMKMYQEQTITVQTLSEER
jgi:hypothetical protein